MHVNFKDTVVYLFSLYVFKDAVALHVLALRTQIPLVRSPSRLLPLPRVDPGVTAPTTIAFTCNALRPAATHSFLSQDALECPRKPYGACAFVIAEAPSPSAFVIAEAPSPSRARAFVITNPAHSFSQVLQ